MNYRIYGNESSKELIRNMITKGREPHSIIIHGERGLGKKKLAFYTAAALLCEEGSGEPCGRCKSCRLILEKAHPDVMMPKSGSKGNYMVDDIRPIVSDAVIAPTESRMKVYIIPDLDRSVITAVQIQNILLKLIEEPPEHTAIIMTAASREVFLPTVLSRVISLAALPVSDAQSAEYLETIIKAQPTEAAEAVQAGRGNIGRCIEYFDGGIFKTAALTARELARAMISKSEYEMLKVLDGTDKSRVLFRECLVLFSEIVRDSMRLRLDPGAVTLSCDEKASKRLGAVLSEGQALQLYELLGRYIRAADANCNLTLAINSLCAELCPK